MTTTTPSLLRTRRPRSWPVLLLALPAFVAIWSGWVGLGSLTGFGIVHPLPGIWDTATLDTAITLPIGVETYAAYALHIWLSRAVDDRAARFAKWSALGSLMLGAGGQVAYHLMVAAGMGRTPWQITALVACLPVAVLGMGAALAHLVTENPTPETQITLSTGPGAEEAPADEASKNAPQTSAPLTTDPPGDNQTADDDAKPGAGVVPPPRPAPRRTARAGRTGTAVKVARLRARHPDWTVGQIAERVGISNRTARRHLNAPTTPNTAPADPAAAGDVAA
jgi:hypothetical protein